MLLQISKDSQKAILIGKGGSKLKELGTMAREKLEKVTVGLLILLFSKRCHHYYSSFYYCCHIYCSCRYRHYYYYYYYHYHKYY